MVFHLGGPNARRGLPPKQRHEINGRLSSLILDPARDLWIRRVQPSTLVSLVANVLAMGTLETIVVALALCAASLLSGITHLQRLATRPFRYWFTM